MNPGKLVRLIQASRMSRDCGLDDLGKIMTISRRNNKNLGVTGSLCYLRLRGLIYECKI